MKKRKNVKFCPTSLGNVVCIDNCQEGKCKAVNNKSSIPNGMEKEVRIVFEEKLNEDGSFTLDSRLETKGNISPYELLGVLRYFEKEIYINITRKANTPKN